MGATLDDLVTILSAETATFKSQINDAVKIVDQGNAKMVASVSKLDTLFAKAGESLKRAFTIGAAAAAVTELLSLEKAAEDSATHLKDVALQADVSYEALQRLRFAASQNGSSADEMDTALAKLFKSMGMAAGGSKELTKVFAALGLEDLIKKGASTEQMVYALSDALVQIKNPAERYAIVVALAGKTSGTLVDMLSQGADHLRSFGDAMPAAAVKSQELIDKLKAAHDRSAAFQEILEGLGSVASGAFVDMVKGLAEAYAWIDKTYDASTKLAQAWSYLSTAASLLAFKMGGASPAASIGSSGLGDPAAVLAQFGPTASGASAKTKPRRAVNQGALSSLFDPSADSSAEAAQKKIDNVINSLKIEAAAFHQSAEATKLDTELKRANTAENTKAGQKIKDLVHQITLEQQAKQNDADDTSLFNEVQAEGTQVTEQMKTATEQAADALEHYKDLFNESAISAETYQRAIDEVNKVTEARQELGNAFADSLSSVATGMEKWNDALKNLLTSLAKAIIQATILKALGLDPGGGAGGSIVSAIFGRASGGGVSGGRAYQINERFPEVFVPDAPGRMVDARGGRGSGGFVQNLHFHGGVTGADVMRAVNFAKREMKAMVVPMVDDAKRRGRLAQSFR